MSEINIYMPDMYECGFSPLKYKSQFDLWGMAALYQGICMYDESLNLRNRLAEYVLEKDGCLEVKLKNLLWHDGMPISAEDFIESFKLYFPNKKTGRIPNGIVSEIIGAEEYYNGNNELKGIEIVDNRIFRINHVAQNLYIKNLLVHPLIPRHTMGIEDNRYIGSGAYILKNYGENYAYFERNDGFCLGTPRIRKLNLYGGTKEEQIHLLEEKELTLTIIEPEDLKNISASLFENYYLFSLPQPITTVLKINPKSPMFMDLNMRMSVSQAIKRGLLVYTMFKDYAEATWSFYPPIIAEKYNCRTLYLDMGLKESMPERIVIGVLYNSSEHIKLAELLSEDLKAKTDVVIMPSASRREAFAKGADVYIENMMHTILPISNQLLYCNSELFIKSVHYKRLIEIEKSLYLQNSQALIREFAMECARSLPVIPIYSKHELQLVSKRVHNLKPDTRGALWNIHEIELD
ncbi:MAG: hypothetical protein K6E39_03765 [Lachnospiraceae bacterium]|nr:hypothetical protein [Lachnospiraceae bacterium]